MLLYTEKQLDEAYRIDCRARTKADKPWVQLEEFRPIYEGLVESLMIAYNTREILPRNIPPYLIDSLNELLEHTMKKDM
jgi:hypothetical protein